jgi:hypothetical protein
MACQGIALLFHVLMMFVRLNRTPMGLYGLLEDSFAFSCVDGVRASQ